MLVGFIQTKDVLLHPVSVISLVGLKGLIKLIRMGLSHRPSTFLEHLDLVRMSRGISPRRF